MVSEVGETSQEDTSANESDWLDEARIITESGLTSDVIDAFSPHIREAGYRLISLNVSNFEGGLIQLFAERPDGSMTIDDCAKLGRVLVKVHREQDWGADYALEVSSPGTARQLVRKSDFERWSGALVRVKLLEGIDGRKRFKGYITGSDETSFTIVTKTDESDDAEGELGQTVVLSFDGLVSVKLVDCAENTLIFQKMTADRQGVEGSGNGA